MLKKSSQHFYKNNLRWLYTIEFFSSLYFLIPVWVSMELTYISLTELALIEVVISASQLLLELPTGALADLLGKRSTVFLGNLITGVAFISFAYATSFYGFLISAFLIGLGAALTSGAKEALLYDTLKQVRKENSFDNIASRQNVVFQSGMAVATFLGGLLWMVNYKLPAILSGVGVLISAIFTLLIIEPSVDSEVFTFKNYVKQTKEGFKEVFKTKYSATLSMFYAFVGGITFTASVVFSKLVFIEMSYSESQMGVFFALARIINSLILFWLITKTKLLSFRRVILIFAFLVPFIFLPGLVMTKFLVIPIVLVIMWLSSARWVLLGKYTNKVFSSKNRATAISSLSMMVSLLYIIIMLISGPLMEHFGGVRMLFTLLGILGLMTVLPIGLQVLSQPSSQD